MNRRAAAAALLLALTASACSDEPEFGPVQNVVAHGPAGSVGDADALEVVTFSETMDGRPQACFGRRTVPPLTDDDTGSGSCIESGDVRELESAAFAEITGPQPLGLVTRDAAVVRAHLHGGGTVEMKPYRHPDLDAGVFAFSIPDTDTVERLVAVDGSGEVIGSTDDLP